MEFFFLLLQGIIVGGIILVIISLLVVKNKSAQGQKNKGKTIEEARGAWPLLGHLHLLQTKALPHKALAAMADKYGPAFFIRLGLHRALVVSNWEVAKECFTTNDKVFPTRPKSVAVKHMGYDNAILGFAPYGPYWRATRKLAVSHLLSAHRLKLLNHIRDSETDLFIKWLNNQCKEKGGRVLIEMKEILGDLAMNIIMRMLAGKRYSGSDEESRRCQSALLDLSRILGTFYISDAVPALAWLDFLKGHIGEMKRTAKELDYILGSLVNEHRQKQLTGKIHETEQDFISIMLSVIDDEKAFNTQEADTVIKATCLSLITGGNDTTTATLTWVLSLLLNNRQVLKKAQDELDAHVGKNRLVNESDVEYLPYLHAVVKETLRLYPAAPLSAAREAMEDCTVTGFNVPKGTQLLLNLWKLHRDPSIWKNPSEFIPERFLEEKSEIDVRGQNFEYLPFGSGRRMCPGVSLALHVIHLALARLLHAFELETASNKPVDMTEGPGLISPKATPLEVILTPRLPAKIYDS